MPSDLHKFIMSFTWADDLVLEEYRNALRRMLNLQESKRWIMRRVVEEISDIALGPSRQISTTKSVDLVPVKKTMISKISDALNYLTSFIV